MWLTWAAPGPLTDPWTHQYPQPAAQNPAAAPRVHLMSSHTGSQGAREDPYAQRVLLRVH